MWQRVWQVALVPVVSLSVILTATPATAAPPQSAPESASLAALAPAAATPRLAATSLSGFEAGRIIDDAVFFDKDTMTAAAIQAFLNQRVPGCQAGYVCLKDFRGPTNYRPADAMCPRPYEGGGEESAAVIIAKVAQSCGINPRVILATLQKEQGLVTHTWPSDWRYRIAMGQGCPDTAACDTRYYGFFNQVYGAAWQFKRYGNPPGTSQYFTWYAPGRTWNIRYNPEVSCGSAPVAVQNQATSNLYYYTPYQPNAAALRAVVGEGDGCSAYGNRNFYYYFTEWFGSTRTSAITLARTASSEAVFLLDGTTKRQVVQWEDFVQLDAVFGPTAIVSDGFLDNFTSSGTTTAVLRDPSTGSMALIQDGRRRGFSDCAQVAQWGASCDSPTNISPAKFQSIPAGPNLTNVFRVSNSARWGAFGGPGIQPYYDEAAARAGTGDTSTAARLPEWRYRQFSLAALRFAPGQLVRSTSKDAVYMTDGWNRLQWVETFTTPAEYGRPASSLIWVPDADLRGYTWNGTDKLSPYAGCQGNVYFAASGSLSRVPSAPAAMLTTLDALTCAQFPRDESLSDLFLRTPSNAAVFRVADGTARPVGTWSAAVQANGGTNPRVVTVSDLTRAKFATGAPIFFEPSFIRSNERPNVYLAMNDRKVGLPSFGLARDLGLSTAVSWHPQAQVDAVPATAAELSSWVSCGSTAYFAAGGTLFSTTADAALGFTATALSDRTCAALRTSDTKLAQVFVKGSSDAVYVASRGTYRPVTSWDALLRLTGGTAPTILRVDNDVFRGLPVGSPVN